MDKITQKDLVSFSKKFNQDSKNILAKNDTKSFCVILSILIYNQKIKFDIFLLYE